MLKKTLIAVLVSLVAAFSAVPAVASSGKGQRHNCAAGVKDKQYCENINAEKHRKNGENNPGNKNGQKNKNSKGNKNGKNNTGKNGKNGKNNTGKNGKHKNRKKHKKG